MCALGVNAFSPVLYSKSGTVGRVGRSLFSRGGAILALPRPLAGSALGEAILPPTAVVPGDAGCGSAEVGRSYVMSIVERARTVAAACKSATFCTVDQDGFPFGRYAAEGETRHCVDPNTAPLHVIVCALLQVSLVGLVRHVHFTV